MTTDTETAAAPVDVRERLALALDVDDLVVATRLARQMKPHFERGLRRADCIRSKRFP